MPSKWRSVATLAFFRLNSFTRRSTKTEPHALELAEVPSLTFSRKDRELTVLLA